MQFHKSHEQLDSEKALIQKAQTGIEHFEPLYNQYFEQVFRFVYQRVNSKDEASDITSQVFLKALLNIKKFEIRKVPFSAWLYRIAINEISSYYSLTKKNRVVNIDTAQLGNIFDDSEINDNEERIEKIAHALKHLTGNDILLIEMRFFEDRPFKEIADILKMTENNAKVKVYRLIDKLKLQIL
jgi:RNA polymerase sigma-70 factor (ECF subfamily)